MTWDLTYALAEEIGDPDLFVGREEEMARLIKWAAGTKRRISKSMGILSRRKKGKTALLQRFFKFSPQIVAGSYIGWLGAILMHMTGRYRVWHLEGLTDEAALEAVYNYAYTYQVPITESTASYIAEVCDNDPFYIAAPGPPPGGERRPLTRGSPIGARGEAAEPQERGHPPRPWPTKRGINNRTLNSGQMPL